MASHRAMGRGYITIGVSIVMADHVRNGDGPAAPLGVACLKGSPPETRPECADGGHGVCSR
jgi:hypothetical protein